MLDKAIEDFKKKLANVRRKTHAGLVLAAAAIIDEQLRDALTDAFPRLRAGKFQKKLFDAYKPLNAFAAKIDVAFAAGVIESETHEKLEVLKKIRNKFAHTPALLTFESDEISSLLPRETGEHADAQTRFLQLMNDIGTEIEQARKNLPR